MILKAIEAFTDRITGEAVDIGDVIERTDERAKELIEKGVCEKSRSKAKKAEKAE